MKKKSKMWLFFLMFAIFFMIPSLVMGGFVVKHFKNKNIASNGIETIAEVVEGSYASGVTVNGVSYYSIQFEFYDENGEIHYGKTSESYTMAQIRHLEESGYITIKYDSKTFKAIEASYSISAGNKFLFFIGGVFALVDLGFWCAVICLIVKEVRCSKLEKNGDEYEATMISYGSNLRVNGVPMYFVTYSWINDRGEFKEGKSRSVFTLNEVLMLEESKIIKIKASGNRSVIVLTTAQLNMENNNKHYEKEINNKCPYCGSKYLKSSNSCPKCGASKLD